VFVGLDKPMVVVVIAEVLEGLVQVFEGGESMDPEKLLFEGSPESLDAAIAFRGADEGGAGVHAEESPFGLEGSRAFNPDWPAERNVSFQPAKVKAATPNSLEGASSSSPRRSRRTVSIFRPELNRPRSPRPGSCSFFESRQEAHWRIKTSPMGLFAHPIAPRQHYRAKCPREGRGGGTLATETPIGRSILMV